MKQLWNYQELHVRTQVPLGTLYHWVSTGKIPHLRLGPRTVRFDPTAIEEWIQSRSVQGGRR